MIKREANFGAQNEGAAGQRRLHRIAKGDTVVGIEKILVPEGAAREGLARIFPDGEGVRRPVRVGKGEAAALSLHRDVRAGQGNTGCFHINRQTADGRLVFCFPGEVIAPDEPAVGGIKTVMFQQRQVVRGMAAGQRIPAGAAAVRGMQRPPVEQEGGGEIEGERILAVQPHPFFPCEIVPVLVGAQSMSVCKLPDAPDGHPPHKVGHQSLRAGVDCGDAPFRPAPEKHLMDRVFFAGTPPAGLVFARDVQVKIDLPRFLLVSCHGTPPSRKILLDNTDRGPG